jgi:hypothetical protein
MSIATILELFVETQMARRGGLVGYMQWPRLFRACCEAMAQVGVTQLQSSIDHCLRLFKAFVIVEF